MTLLGFGEGKLLEKVNGFRGRKTLTAVGVVVIAGTRHTIPVSDWDSTVHASPPTVTVASGLKPKPAMVRRRPPLRLPEVGEIEDRPEVKVKVVEPEVCPLLACTMTA